jgi:hypothetical protein
MQATFKSKGFISPRNVALLVAAGVIASASPALAADTTTATTKVYNTLSTFRLAQIQYQKDVATYIQARQAVTNKFLAAVAAANDAVVAAVPSAKTADDRKAIAATHKAAIAAAKSARDAALAALVKPTKPVKPAN